MSVKEQVIEQFNDFPIIDLQDISDEIALLAAVNEAETDITNNHSSPTKK